MKCGVIGFGEIGQAIVASHVDPTAVVVCDPDQGHDDHVFDCDVIHICVPGKVVQELELPLRPRLIVHSTVPVGTCRTLHEHGHRVLHAPVVGRHPNLMEGLRAHRMPVSGPAPQEGIRHLEQMGIPACVDWGPRWEVTELAKLLSTLRLGWEILFQRHAFDLAERYDVNPFDVYTEWTKHYNDGISERGLPQLARSIISPKNGPIGGHCVLPNAELLDDSWIATVIKIMGINNWKHPDASS